MNQIIVGKLLWSPLLLLSPFVLPRSAERQFVSQIGDHYFNYCSWWEAKTSNYSHLKIIYRTKSWCPITLAYFEVKVSLATLAKMEKWLIGLGPKPSTPSKRKAENAPESESPSKRFTKEVPQSSFDWYKQDEAGKWHCSVCRLAKVNGVWMYTK